jgi:hypothetical protein
VKPDIFQSKLKRKAASKHRQLAEQYGDEDAAAERRERLQRSLSPRREARANDTGEPKRGKSLALVPYSPAASEPDGRSRSLVKKRTLRPLAANLPPTMSPGLRLGLLQQESGPDYPVYEATANVLADMTNVLAQGL